MPSGQRLDAGMGGGEPEALQQLQRARFLAAAMPFSRAR